MRTLIQQVIVRIRIVMEQYKKYGSEPPHPPMKPEKNGENIINNADRRNVPATIYDKKGRIRECSKME